EIEPARAFAISRDAGMSVPDRRDHEAKQREHLDGHVANLLLVFNDEHLDVIASLAGMRRLGHVSDSGHAGRRSQQPANLRASSGSTSSTRRERSVGSITN